MGFFTPSNLEHLNDYDKTRYKIIWRLLLIFTAIFAALCFFFEASSKFGFYLYLFVFLLCIGTTIFLRITKLFIVPYYIFSFGASIVLTLAFLFLDNILHYPDILWIVNIVLFALIGLGRRWAFFFLIYLSAVLLWFIMFKLNSNLENISTFTTSRLQGIMIEIICCFCAIYYQFNVYVKFKDYFEKELTIKNKKLELINKEIAQKNSENEVLLKEVHHRVKNNLQIVISMLRMQANELNNSEIIDQFNEAISRVMAIALIHQKLYEQNNLSEVNCKNYFTQLIQEIEKLHDAKVNISLDIDSNIHSLNLNSIVPLGLIINELITNSIKHFDNSTDLPKIDLSLNKNPENTFILSYSDNGTWKESKDGEKGSRLGLELIAVLVEQMEGSYEREGTRYRFLVKNIGQ